MPENIRDLVEGILEQEIEDGNYFAANDLGALYYDEQSYEKAFEYYNLASNNGIYLATENLGYIYYYGRLGEVNYEKAFECFIKGALNGQIISLYKIGDMYKNGYYVSKDENLAYKIYDRCMEILDNETDKDERRHLIELAAADVYIRFADSLLNGIGCEIDVERAYFWATKANVEFYRRVKNGKTIAKKGYDWSNNLLEKCKEELNNNLLNN